MVDAIAATAASSLRPQDKLMQQAKELEGVFLNLLLKESFGSLDARSGFGGGFAEETWRSIQAEQMASAMSEAGGIGLAEQIHAQLTASQSAFAPQFATGAYAATGAKVQ